MAIKPILFNTEMVRAILDGRKTCTRRLIKCHYSNTHLEIFKNKYGTRLIEIQNDVEGETFGTREDGTHWRKIRGARETEYEHKPYHKGDILYVRETWAKHPQLNVYYYRADSICDGHSTKWGCPKAYDKTNNCILCEWLNGYIKWRPSIHMPKAAARIWLKVTDVRVERLQDITEEQAKAEGAVDNRSLIHPPENEYSNIHSAKEHFANIWDSTVNKKQLEIYGWQANPWVLVIEFEQCEKPVN